MAELYYEVADDEFIQQMQEYDQRLEQIDNVDVDSSFKEPVKDFSISLRIYQQILDDFPHSDLVDDALYNKGFISEETGKIDSALIIYHSLVKEYPDSRYVPESLMRIAEYYFNPPKNDIASAIGYYKRILDYKDSPKYDEALYRLGWSYYRLSNYSEAVSYFTILADDIERAKEIDHPVEVVNQCHAGQDQRCPEHQRSDNAPKQHAVLVFGGYLKIGEDQDEYENVVQAQRVLDQVAREELQRRLAAAPEVDAHVERQGQGNPECAPG